MCEKHTEKRINSIDDENNEFEDNEEEDNDSGMTREEFERKFRKHMERRKSAYVKMGTVDKPRK